MMALGIPGDIVTAVMLGALLIHNVQPSPTFISDNPQLAYAIFVAFFLAHFIMIVMQAFCLRAFLWIVRMPMYFLAAVILMYCAIGVFALGNVTFNIWVLFAFGIVGYIMKSLGFPLAPIILGVVLGNIAELNLSRAVGISDDLTLFVTRPWALFFFIVALFSAVFPWYQQRRESKQWTLAYVPLACLALSVPLIMMGGWVRPLIAALLLAWGLHKLYRHHRAGWALPKARSEADEAA